MDELVAFGDQVLTKKIHERVDFAPRAVPVLFAERVKGECRNAESPCRAHHIAHRIRTAGMPRRTRLPSRLRPTPVAVHNDRDMLRESAHVDQTHGERVSWAPQPSKNTKSPANRPFTRLT